MALFTCTGCHRHLRIDGARACRFCGAELPELAAPAVPASPVGEGVRLSRAAAAAAAFSAALGVSACSRESVPADVYGSPPEVRSDAGGAAGDTPTPSSTPYIRPTAAVYGGPPPLEDSEPKPKPKPPSDLKAPAYGAPPPRTP